MAEEGGRLLLLVGSFVALLWFGRASLHRGAEWSRNLLIGGPLLLWLGSIITLWLLWRPALLVWFDLVDVLSRYLLCIPGALLGAWVLMQQQHRFREQNLVQFSRDPVWYTSALLLYGLVGQLFVRPTALPPSTFLNSATFLAWFGIPVQLLRAVLVSAFTVYLVKGPARL